MLAAGLPYNAGMIEVAVTNGKTRPFYGYVLAGYSFFLLFLVSSFFLHSRGIFFPVWMEHFNVARTEISFAITLTLFVGSCVAPIVGYLIDRFPVRIITIAGAVWLAIGYVLFRFVDSFVGFFFCLLVFQGLGWVCVGPLVQTKLIVSWFSRNRGMALGIAIMGISVAGVVMPTVATFLSQNQLHRRRLRHLSCSSPCRSSAWANRLERCTSCWYQMLTELSGCLCLPP